MAKKQTYYFSGPGGSRSVVAISEREARHLAMVERWGEPNGRPCIDVEEDGMYKSLGLDLIRVEK